MGVNSKFISPFNTTTTTPTATTWGTITGDIQDQTDLTELVNKSRYEASLKLYASTNHLPRKTLELDPEVEDEKGDTDYSVNDDLKFVKADYNSLDVKSITILLGGVNNADTVVNEIIDATGYDLLGGLKNHREIRISSFSICNYSITFEEGGNLRMINGIPAKIKCNGLDYINFIWQDNIGKFKQVGGFNFD